MQRAPLTDGKKRVWEEEESSTNIHTSFIKNHILHTKTIRRVINFRNIVGEGEVIESWI